MIDHGGRLSAAAREYGIPLAEWLDLSTGINPHGWPIPGIPPEAWRRLPDDDDGLAETARRYLGARHVLPVAGTQAAILALPRLRPPCRVGVLHPTYAEHAHAWREAGHEVVAWTPEYPVDRLDVLVLVHPNNPTGLRFWTAQLIDWHGQLAKRDGWLVVDEAFMDATPHASLAPCCDRRGLVVLRSLGKFFGLAGARIGFVLAEAGLLADLHGLLGPWTLAGPSRWLAREAMWDAGWQADARHRLHEARDRLARMLAVHGLLPSGGTALFQWVKTRHAEAIHVRLARRGILTRRFDDPPSLRFGLPGADGEWARLEAELKGIAS